MDSHSSSFGKVHVHVSAYMCVPCTLVWDTVIAYTFGNNYNQVHIMHIRDENNFSKMASQMSDQLYG